jgi:hypothetical protein
VYLLAAILMLSGTWLVNRDPSVRVSAPVLTR